jgi:prepilin-type N-terminal cleavage/methylation domain-containing protein
LRAGIFRLLRRLNPVAHKSQGFTLIEIVIVLFIMATFITIALPNLPDITGHRLNTSARKIANIIKYTRNRAIIEKKTLYIIFNARGNSYFVKEPVLKNDEIELVEYKSDFMLNGELPDNIQFEDILTSNKNSDSSSDETIVSFGPGGYIDKTLIHIVDSKNRKKTLIVHPATGRVTIHDGYIKKEF